MDKSSLERFIFIFMNPMGEANVHRIQGKVMKKKNSISTTIKMKNKVTASSLRRSWTFSENDEEFPDGKAARGRKIFADNFLTLVRIRFAWSLDCKSRRLSSFHDHMRTHPIQSSNRNTHDFCYISHKDPEKSCKRSGPWEYKNSCD